MNPYIQAIFIQTFSLSPIKFTKIQSKQACNHKSIKALVYTITINENYLKRHSTCLSAASATRGNLGTLPMKQDDDP